MQANMMHELLTDQSYNNPYVAVEDLKDWLNVANGQLSLGSQYAKLIYTSIQLWGSTNCKQLKLEVNLCKWFLEVWQEPSTC